MISLFKVYNEVTLLLLFGVSLLLNINIVFYPNEFALQGYMPISDGLAKIVQNFLEIPKWLYFILYIIIQFSSAIYFGIVMAKHKIVTQYSYIPALLFITLFALINTYTFNCVAFILLPVFILLFDRVFSIAINDKNLTNAFDLGLICGTLFFSYLPYALLVVFAYFMFIILKPFYWRDWVASAIGFVCPLLIALIFYAIFNLTGVFFEYFTSGEPFLYSKSVISVSLLLQHLSVVTVIIAILSFFRSSAQYKTIPFIRNYLFLIVGLALILMLFQLIGGLWTVELLIVVFIIITIVLTNFIIKCRSAIIKNALHVVMLLYLIYFQYFSGN